MKYGRLEIIFNSEKSYIKKGDHVYLRHLSTEYQSILLADIPTDSRPISRPILSRVGMSVDTRPTPRPICCDRLSVVYRSTVGAIGVLLTVVLLK